MIVIREHREPIARTVLPKTFDIRMKIAPIAMSVTGL